MSHQATQHWPCDGRSVADVRQYVLAHCQQWQLAGITDDLVLIASEMATNAVTHARSSFRLRLSVIDDDVLIEISDSDPRLPPAPAPAWRTTALTGSEAAGLDHVDLLLGSQLDQEDVSGRGLMIVAALAASWGVVSEQPPGKTVWAACHR